MEVHAKVVSMKSRREVMDEFQERSQQESGELYLSLGDTLELLRVCNENNLAMQAIEGVVYDGSYLWADPELILDSTMPPTRQTWELEREFCNNEAERFLERMVPQQGLLLIPDIADEGTWERWAEEDRASPPNAR